VTPVGLGGPVDDLITEIAGCVAQVETGMGLAAIDDIVASFATTRSRIRRLAGAVADRPAVLTAGLRHRWRWATC